MSQYSLMLDETISQSIFDECDNEFYRDENDSYIENVTDELPEKKVKEEGFDGF